MLQLLCEELKYMPFCTKCGSQVDPNGNFCQTCGASIKAQISIPITPNPAPAPAASVAAAQQPAPAQTAPAQPPATVNANGANVETVVGVILLTKPKSLGRYDSFTAVVTTRRLILAQMTSQMLTDAAMQARTQAKA